MKLGLWPIPVLALIAANCQGAQQQRSTVASFDTAADEVAIRSLSRAFDSLLTASQEDPFLALLTADVAVEPTAVTFCGRIQAVSHRGSRGLR